jgi:soluble lytic murein transglycosylase-like protein
LLIRPTRIVWFQVALGIGSVAAIIVAASVSRPFYMARASVAKQLLTHAYVDQTAQRAPWLRVSTDLALQSPQFLRDRELFTMDLLRTGHVSLTRARTLADIAVREAYTRKIPPALVLGVMLTENDELKSTARSRIGAVGLMQVYPKHWLDALGRKFGTNIGADSTNLKYGIFILGHLASKAADATEQTLETSWRKALLSYNGCSSGTNTRNCRSYPDEVRRQVQRAAKSSCEGADFDHCVAQPLWESKRDSADGASALR